MISILIIFIIITLSFLLESKHIESNLFIIPLSNQYQKKENSFITCTTRNVEFTQKGIDTH